VGEGAEGAYVTSLQLSNRVYSVGMAVTKHAHPTLKNPVFLTEGFFCIERRFSYEFEPKTKNLQHHVTTSSNTVILVT
jgi:hypothetical protein